MEIIKASIDIYVYTFHYVNEMYIDHRFHHVPRIVLTGNFMYNKKERESVRVTKREGE